MKRLLIALLLLLLAGPAIACEGDGCRDDVGKLAMMNGPMLGGGVEACVTPSGNILSEGFPSTPDNTWAAVTLTPTYGHTLQDGASTGSCSDGLQLTLTDTANRERIYWTYSSTVAADAAADVKFSLYINSSDQPDAGLGRGIVGFSNTNEGANNYIAIAKDAGGQLQMWCAAATSSTKSNISTGTWYEVTMHLDSTAASSYCIVSGSGLTTCDVASECTFTRYTTADIKYAVIGKNAYFGEAIDFEIGYITINTP